MNRPDKEHSSAGIISSRYGRILRTLSSLLLLGIITAGCTITRQQTHVAGATEELKEWNRHEVRWVETVTGERYEFVEESGRIDVSRNPETRLIEFVIIGTDSLGVEHHLDVENLALINTLSTREDPAAFAGVLLLTATIAAGVLLFSSSPLF